MRNHWRINFVLPLRDALSEWERQAESGRKPRTIEYNRRLAVLIRANWASELDTPCKDISADSAAAFGAAVDRYSASQYNHLVNVVHALVPAACFLRRKSEKPKIVRMPTQQLFDSLLAELDQGRSAVGGQVARLLACTGLRIGEARALTGEDVLPGGLLVRDSKSGRPRLVPYVGACREIVAKLLAAKNGSPRLIVVKGIRRALTEAGKRAGIPHFTHHDFRRLFATKCIESGVDLPTAARWLGHSDGGALLARTYFHLLDAHSADMAARVKI